MPQTPHPRPTPLTGIRCLLGVAALMVLAVLPARAAGDPAQLCDRAARMAASRTGVPVAVLRAIALTETGRTRDGRISPWPWTVNMEGAGHWFDSRAEAEAYVRRHQARGARSFDIGCFQINFRWHGAAFDSAAQMFEPEAGALYAAHFLQELYAETGTWPAAAGAYHSRTPALASRYRARFERHLARVAAAPPAERAPEAPPAPVSRAGANRYPLLQPGRTETATRGSLVPLREAALFGPFVGAGAR